MEIKIFYDAPQEIEWFKSLDNRLKNIDSQKIMPRGQNSLNIINELILYDRPDIIVLKNKKPVLVIEKTEEVPSGHNVGQRIGRLARAVELNVPIIKFFPYLAKKHGKFASKCYVRPNIFLAFKKMSKFHNVPVLAINWVCNKDGELIKDGSENDEIAKLIKDFIDMEFSFNNQLKVSKIENTMQKEYAQRVESSIHYRQLAPSVSIEKTKDLLNKFELKNINNLLKKQETFVYMIEMTPENCRREDPYTGTQFIYDYAYCRIGPTIEDRNKNFALYFPLITKCRWLEANPEDQNRKSFLWYVLADFMIFKDGILLRKKDYDLPLKEPEMYLLAKKFLLNNGWQILGGEPPDGTDHIPRIELHDPDNVSRGSKGSKKIDLIAFKNKKLLLLELKTFFNLKDIIKLDEIVSNKKWLIELNNAIESKTTFDTTKYNKILKSIGVSEYHSFPEDFTMIVFSRRDFELYIGKKCNTNLKEFLN